MVKPKPIPSELLLEIVRGLPLNIRWATQRISSAFDYFIIKNQFTWIKGELVRQTILRQKRAELASAQHLIVNYVPILNHHQLDTITMSFCAHFRVLENFGANNIHAGLSRVEFFIMQFDAIISGCVDPNNIAEIHAATFFLQAQYEMIRLFHVV